MTTPLSAEALEERLDHSLDAALSSRRTAAGVARSLAGCGRAQQEFVLHWVAAVAPSNAEIAYQFAASAAQALQLLDEDGVVAWLMHAMDVYDKHGLYPAVNALHELESYSRQRRLKSSGLPLEEVSGVLEHFIAGLSGRRLTVSAAEHAVYTDTESLFLPALLNRFERREDNFRLYKIMAVHLWAQTRFGTWRVNLQQELARFPQPERACRLFHSLERLRLDACIQRELPGLFRDLELLLDSLGERRVAPGWEAFAPRFSSPAATAQDSFDLLAHIYDNAEDAPECCYQGVLLPDKVQEIMQLRLARERDMLRLMLLQMADEKAPPPAQKPDEPAQSGLDRIQIQVKPPEEQPEQQVFQITLDGLPVAPPDKVKGLVESIIQDLGNVPPDYLVAAGPGEYKARQSERSADSAWAGVYHEEGAFLYNEWDCDRKHYRKNWCALRELDVHPHPEDFVQHALRKHRGLVKTLRRTFEALRGEDKMLRAQPNGEDLDLDAFVTAYADAHSGMELTNRVFTKLQRDERNIAVMFMVDMSGSTKGWINDAEREALALLCEALETLGDRYAIYGFSGMTRKRCEAYRIKRFDEPYNSLVRQRISGITPRDYTRMGVAIRHLSHLLSEVDARTKLLVTLSDGRPDDYGDNYRGIYGIEDTRQALLEAKRLGIHPFCITLDTEARDYLARMYGQVNYTVIDEVRRLPLKISDIYRKLTSR